MAESQPITSEHLQSGIYAIRCIPTGKRYVGSAASIKKRWGDHSRLLMRDGHHSRHLQQAWKKYGPDAFAWEILELVEEILLLDREQHFIDLHRAADQRFGFNVRPVARSNKGLKFSEESRARVSESLRGRRHSEESRRKMADAHRGKGLSAETRAKLADAHRGKAIPPEARENMAAAHRGKPMSAGSLAKLIERNSCPEHRAKLSELLTGIVRSPETRARISEAKKGIVFSAETRAKMSQAARNRVRPPHSPETRAKISEALRRAKNQPPRDECKKSHDTLE